MSEGQPVAGVFWRLRQRLGGTTEGRVRYECRRCGCSLQAIHVCPDCGAVDVASYEL